MKRPRLLDAFCGAGGSTKGYQRAGFYVTGVDIKPQPHYCGDEFIRADALEYIREHGHEYDIIHASPPCQAYTGMRGLTLARFGTAPEHPDLVAATREVLMATKKPYVIENVQGSPVHTQFILCAASFGMNHLARHRHFESNVLLLGAPQCAHRQNVYTIGVYGERPDGRRVSYPHHRLVRVARSLAEAREEMGIAWMTWNEITQAIPPAYTEWIGHGLMSYLNST